MLLIRGAVRIWFYLGLDVFNLLAEFRNQGLVHLDFIQIFLLNFKISFLELLVFSRPSRFRTWDHRTRTPPIYGERTISWGYWWSRLGLGPLSRWQPYCCRDSWVGGTFNLLIINRRNSHTNISIKAFIYIYKLACPEYKLEVRAVINVHIEIEK